MEMLKFSERLYTLDVGEVRREEIPRIVDPNDAQSNNGVIVCFYPTKDQLIQLALTIWQVATRERNASQQRTRQFEIAEERCTKTRNVLKSLLLPFVEGNPDKARDLCVRLLREHKPTLDKYIKGWSIIKRPNSVWVDKDARGIFLCENEGRILVGLNPTNYVFAYDQGK
jgi:hypothetical protein